MNYIDKREWYMKKSSTELNYILRNIDVAFNTSSSLPIDDPNRADDHLLNSWSHQYNTVEEILIQRGELEG